MDIGRATIRHDGWTVERQLGFLRALADGGSVTRAAAAVGMSPASAYRRRGRARGDAFAYGWQAAQAMAYYRLRDIALERIEHGVVTPSTFRGEVVDTKVVFSDRLLVALLDHLRPASQPVRPERVMADPAGDFAAAMAAYDDAIAEGRDPVCPADATSGGAQPTMSRAEFMAFVRAQPRLDPLRDDWGGDGGWNDAGESPAPAGEGAGENDGAGVTFA